MPETARTFESIARQIDQARQLPALHTDRHARLAAIVEQLRQVWNARGAADAATYDPYLHGVVTPGIRALDR